MARTQDIPAWVAGYIGIPFADRGRDRNGCDCWGLMRLVLTERFRIELPSYDGAYFSTLDFAAMQRLHAEQEQAGFWIEVMEKYERPGLEQPGDVVLMRIEGQPLHVGVVFAQGWMLHTCAGADSVRQQFDRLAWKNRVIGIYRHKALAARE